MPTILCRDNVEICYKDWGPKEGPVVILSHGWAGCSDSWEAQAFFLAGEGFRVIAHDRRGHGRSSQPWEGNDINQYADDLSQVMGALDLHDVVLFGFCAGAGEVARYVGRHGTKCVRRIGLVAAVTPKLVQSEDNPGGLPLAVLDRYRARSIADRSQLYRELGEGPIFGFNRSAAQRSQGAVDAFWLRGMMGGHKNLYDSLRAVFETDYTEDLKQFDRPTLIVHGDDDQVVPIDASAKATKKLVPHAQLKIYAGAPHGILDTHQDELNRDMLAFLSA